MKVGLAGGTLAYKDQELTLYRTGKPEQVWMNLDYSPVFDESGKPGGVIAIVIETTDRVLADRRAAAEQERQGQLLKPNAGLCRCPDRPRSHLTSTSMTPTSKSRDAAILSDVAFGRCFRS